MPAPARLSCMAPDGGPFTVGRWLVKEGQHVAVGHVLVEIEIDFACAEIDLHCDGVVRRILVAEGKTFDPDQLLLEMDESA